MGPLGVEFADKIIETGLLLQGVHFWWSGCFFFECEMHTLMAAILLGTTRLDAFDFDAKAQPPD